MYYIENEPAIVREARERILEEFKDLTFQEEGHIYTLHGKVIETTISALGHRFESRPFDTELQAQRYALRHGQTPEYWKEQWAANALRATTLGTKAHEYGESLAYVLNGLPEDMILESARGQYDALTHTIIPASPKEQAAEKFLRAIPSSYHLVLNEARVYSGKNPNPAMNIKELICGTFDMLYWFDGEGNPERAGFYLFDYKTNAKLENEFNRRNNVFLLPPFDKIYEESLGTYTIQLSAYQMLLEDIGLPVIGRCLVWLKDDGDYKLVPVPNVVAKLRRCL